MSQILYYSLAWPFILIGALVEFLVWVLFSDGRWRENQKRSNPAIRWQNENSRCKTSASRFQYKSRRQKDDDDDKFRKELKRKEREINIPRP